MRVAQGRVKMCLLRSTMLCLAKVLVYWSGVRHISWCFTGLESIVFSFSVLI